MVKLKIVRKNLHFFLKSWKKVEKKWKKNGKIEMWKKFHIFKKCTKVHFYVKMKKSGKKVVKKW